MKISQNSNSNKSAVEAGLYPAVCFALIDLGTQDNEYQGKKITQRKVILKFELLDEFSEEDKRIVLSQIYTLSMNEMSKFRKHLKGWRGRDFTDEELSGFEPKNILNTNVILNVIENDKGRAIIDGMAKYKDDPIKSDRNIEYFSFDEFDDEFLPEFISDGIANLIEKSHQWKNLSKSGVVNSVKNNEMEADEIPF